MPLTEKDEMALKRSLLSVLKWALRRARLYPNLTPRELLETALKLANAGITEIDKLKRPLMLEKSLSVLNWAEARAKTVKVSPQTLLESAVNVAKRVEEMKEEVKT